MFITKDKPNVKQEAQSSQEVLELFRRQEETILRVVNLERILMERMELTKKELIVKFQNVQKEALIASFDHEKTEPYVQLDPIIVTNE